MTHSKLDSMLAAVWREAERIGVGVVRGDPVTATLVTAGVSTMAAMGGTLMSAQAASANQSAQAKVANYNAQIETQLGNQAAQAGAAKEEQQRRANADIEGKQFAAISQTGIGVQSASAQDVMRQQRINDELDALNIRYEGQLQKANYADSAATFQAEAAMRDQNARNAITSGYFGAAGDLLQSFGDYRQAKFGPGPGTLIPGGNGATYPWSWSFSP